MAFDLTQNILNDLKDNWRQLGDVLADWMSVSLPPGVKWTGPRLQIKWC
jgi:hypothetical protein